MAHESVLHHRLLWSLTEVQMGLCICPNKQKPLPSYDPPLLQNTTTIQLPPDSKALPLRLALTRKQTAERQKWADREGMHLRARCSDKEKKSADVYWKGQQKRKKERKRERKVSIRGAWSLWTMAARFKAPQKEPSSAMTDSADKRWSMKADRCADSRREALAPAGRVHYCGQTQLSGPNGPSAFCRATTLTSHGQSQGLSTPCFTPFSHRTLHSSAETFPGQSIAQLHLGVYISWQVLKLTYRSNSLTYWQCVKECRGALSEGFLTGKA